MKEADAHRAQEPPRDRPSRICTQAARPQPACAAPVPAAPAAPWGRSAAQDTAPFDQWTDEVSFSTALRGAETRRAACSGVPSRAAFAATGRGARAAASLRRRWRRAAPPPGRSRSGAPRRGEKGAAAAAAPREGAGRGRAGAQRSARALTRSAPRAASPCPASALRAAGARGARRARLLGARQRGACCRAPAARAKAVGLRGEGRGEHARTRTDAMSRVASCPSGAREPHTKQRLRGSARCVWTK